MPKKSKKQQVQEYVSDFALEEGESENIGTKSETTIAMGKRRAKKRTSEISYKGESDEELDDEHEQMPVTNILKQFGTDLQKTINCKRKKLENFTSQCNSSRAKVNALLQVQKKSRKNLYDEFKKQMTTVLSQWDADIARAKESEEKLNNLLSQQMKLISQIRIVQTQRYKSMKQLHDQYNRSVSEVETSHEDQQKNVSVDMENELTNLQKKFLLETVRFLSVVYSVAYLTNQLQNRDFYRQTDRQVNTKIVKRVNKKITNKVNRKHNRKQNRNPPRN